MKNGFRALVSAMSLIAFLFALSLPGIAQERTGELSGTVRDASQAVVPNVKVTITNRALNRSITTQSGGDGSWIVRELEPGRYSVRFEAQGFQKYEVPDVLLVVGQRLTVNGVLTVGSVDQTIQVSEAAPLIDTTRTQIAHNVTAEEFDRLPKARTFQSLALASPSVNTGEIEGGFQVNGSSGAENQFNIDGVSTTSLINGKSRQDAVFEILQEVQVKTGGIDAEYGGALGGVISAITKSGGNAFHGDLHYYYSGNGISAAPVLRLFADPVTEKTAKHFQDTKQTDNSNEIGGSLGGYFIKNKLYFFSAFSPRWRHREGTYKYSNGAETASNYRDNTYYQLFNKLSWDPVSRVRTNFSWLWSPSKQLGYLPNLNAYAPDTTVTSVASMLPQKDIGNYQPQSNYTGQVDISITPTSLLTIRGGRFWDNFKSLGYPEVQNIQYLTSASSLPFSIPAALAQPKGYQNIPRGAITDFDIVTRTFVQTDFSKFGNFLGQHNIKGGWGFTKTVNRVLTREAYNGWIGIYWNSASPYAPAGSPGRGTYGYYEYNEVGTAGSTGAGMHNLFIQDQWRVLPRLTLTLGLRTENEYVPSVNRTLKDYAFHFGFGDKLAPRLGASYDVFGDGRVKVYGSWGRYFDWVKYELSRGSYGGDYWRVYYSTLDSPNVFTDLATVKPPNLPGTSVWRTTGFRNRRANYIESVDEDVKPMSQDNMNIGTELRIAPQTVLRANYVHNNLRRTIEDLGALDANGDEIYLHGNPGEGHALIMPVSGKTKPFPMPKAVRKYDAMELSVTRRFSKGMFGSFSYVYSRLYGNYAGLASSDEITSPATGNASRTAQQQGGSIARSGGNVNRAWDLDEVLFDSHGNLDIKGRLATDRPHVFKLYGNKEFNWKPGATDIGIFQYAGSGTPLTMVVQTVNQIPIMVEGRGSMGRTPFLTQTDLVLGHTIKFGEIKRLRFEFNALNVFNQKTARSRFTSLNRGAGAGGGQPGSAINLSNTDLTQGFDYVSMINNSADQRSGRGAYDPLFGLADIFSTGFAGRFGIKFTF